MDLFAGSGGLGLEALSRGAAYVAFVENNPDNEKLINGNIAKLSVEDRCRLFMMDFERAIGLMASRGVKFDVVFIDRRIMTDSMIERLSFCLNPNYSTMAQYAWWSIPKP